MNYTIKTILFLAITIFSFISCEEPTELKGLNFQQVNLDNITLTLVKENIPADGKSLAELILSVNDSSALARYSNVIFTIFPVGKFADDSQLINAKIDLNGEAKVLVKSIEPGIATINAEIVGLGSISTNVNFESTCEENYVLSIASESVVADGATKGAVLFKADPTFISQVENVTFLVSPIGKFHNNNDTISVTIDSNGEAYAYISSPDQGTALIQAQTNYCTKSISVNFTTSFPEQVLMLPAVSSMPSSFSSNTNIIAKLIRTNGVVSSGFLVNFYDSTEINTSVGTFLNTILSNNIGEATTTYSIQDTSYHGIVYINGYIETNEGRVNGVSKILIE